MPYDPHTEYKGYLLLYDALQKSSKQFNDFLYGMAMPNTPTDKGGAAKLPAGFASGMQDSLLSQLAGAVGGPTAGADAATAGATASAIMNGLNGAAGSAAFD